MPLGHPRRRRGAARRSTSPDQPVAKPAGPLCGTKGCDMCRGEVVPGNIDDPMLRRILEWVDERRDIQLVVLTGSRGRLNARPDEFSDYDVELYSSDRERYRPGTWERELGPVW